MNGRVAAVLGVGPGLGAAVARRFAGEGFAVAMMARRKESLAEIRQYIEGEGGTALPVSADATDPDSVAAAFELQEMSPDREEHTLLSPEAIAETYWQLHSQDRTAWTLELDLRPSVESF